MASPSWPPRNGNIVRLRAEMAGTGLGKWLSLSGCPGAGVGWGVPPALIFPDSLPLRCFPLSDHGLA